MALPLMERYTESLPIIEYEGDAPGLTYADVFDLSGDSMRVAKKHCNGVGGLHGGAKAVRNGYASTSVVQL